MKSINKAENAKTVTTQLKTKIIMELLEIKKDAGMTRIYSALKCSDFFNTKTA